nr:MAG TPA: chromosomal replication initiator protein [Caudoviricetes sp.]
MKKIYISGPISGLPLETVYNNFTNAEVQLLEQGYEVVNPFNNGLPPTATWEEHMRADLKLLLDCDAIYMLEGWEKSRGARIEYALAVDLKMDVQYQFKYSHALNLDLSIYSEPLNLTLSDMLSRCRKIRCMLPRQVIMHHLRYVKNISLIDIGRAFGLDHSTISNATIKIGALIQAKDKEVLEMVDKIKAL